MANKHNDYFNKQSTKSNLGSKQDIKKKKKFTFYLIIFLMAFCVIGSIFGSFAFVENRFANAELNPVNTSLNFRESEVNTNDEYIITNGVSTNIHLTDYRNIGWAGWNADMGDVRIYNNYDLGSSNVFPCIQYRLLQGTNIIPFITFSSDIYLAPFTTYVATMKFNIGARRYSSANYPDIITNLDNFSFYFLGGPQVSLTDKVVNSTEERIDNSIVRTIKFTFTNNTDQYLTYSSYRFNINFKEYLNMNKNAFTLYEFDIEIADYSLGYENGYNQGNADGYQNGFNNGYNEGKSDGYQDGLEKENTFYSLFSAIIDVPIKAFTSLFNFEIFGQNLTNFFLALITFAVVIKIVQLLL